MNDRRSTVYVSGAHAHDYTLFDHQAHIDMWTWLAENPGRIWRFTEERDGMLIGIRNERYFICKQAQYDVEDHDSCLRCPFQQLEKRNAWGRIPCLGGFYLEWSRYTHIVRTLEETPLNPRSIKRLCSMYARSIANMPLKKIMNLS